MISGNVFIGDSDHNYSNILVPVIEQSIIPDRIEIGDDSFIGYGAVIQAGVILGKHCVIGSNAVVRKGSYPDYSILAGIPAKIVKRYNGDKKCWEKSI